VVSYPGGQDGVHPLAGQEATAYAQSSASEIKGHPKRWGQGARFGVSCTKHGVNCAAATQWTISWQFCTPPKRRTIISGMPLMNVTVRKRLFVTQRG
jgi:hypothetical protein